MGTSSQETPNAPISPHSTPFGWFPGAHGESGCSVNSPFAGVDFGVRSHRVD